MNVSRQNKFHIVILTGYSKFTTILTIVMTIDGKTNELVDFCLASQF